MSDVGNDLKAGNAGWTFSGDVAKKFDAHVGMSVPLYKEGQKLICQLSDYFISNNSICYDLGTSTGEIPIQLSQHNKDTHPLSRFFGIDIVEEMVGQAQNKKQKKNIKNVEFFVDDICLFDYEMSDFITSYYTIQFIKPRDRQDLFNKIYKSLNWGGAFLLFEKVRGPDARFQDIATGLYNEFKLEQNFTVEEIFSKTRSLKGVLEPFSTKGNYEMLNRAGFKDIMTIMKFVSFEGFLCIK